MMTFRSCCLAVASLTAQAQDFNLSILSVPKNDNFENASTFLPNVAVSFNQLRSATRQTGEPNHAGQASGHSLWWTWTPARSGQYLWSYTDHFSPANPPSLPLATAIYTGADLSSLTVVAINLWG